MFVINGDCIEVMRTLPDNSVDAIVTDPPYGLSKEPDPFEVVAHWLVGDEYKHTGAGFMGKTWDSFVPGPAVWREALRILKPGGHMLVFAGSRTYDLMALSVRMGGFEIRDQLMWLYGSGFPKSLDVSKAIDKAAGAERPVVGEWHKPGRGSRNPEQKYGLTNDSGTITAPATAAAAAAAAAWSGWGTALKPAHEPIIMARKPFKGTIADNVQAHGTAAINIDGCRVPTADKLTGGAGGLLSHQRDQKEYDGQGTYNPSDLGRWPANVLHDGCLPEPMDRFFYCAKASTADRNAGLDSLAVLAGGEATGGRPDGSDGLNSPRAGAGRKGNSKNPHPTVKPTDLMRWCCRLITPPNGFIFDPFTGSGSTGRGALLEGFGFMGAELDPEYCAVAELRIADALLTAADNKA